MKPEEILSGILDTIEKQSIKTKDGEKHLIQENFIPEKYSESIRKYLVEPYENGFWEIESEWNYYSDFHKEIISQTKILPDINNFDKNKEEFFKFINENNNEQDKRNLIRILKRASFPLHVFEDIFSKRTDKPSKYLEKIDINIEAIKEKFIEAGEIYKDSIWFDGIQSTLFSGQPFKLQSSFLFFLSSPRYSKKIHLVSTEKNDLENIAKFYFSLGIINNKKIKRVFAPDESLFKPYFTMLSSIFNNVVTDKGTSKKFFEALTYYKD